MLEKLAKALELTARPVVFFVSAGLAILFVLFAIPFNDQAAVWFGLSADFTVSYFGWFYILTVTGGLLFLIWLALSRYGTIRLSKDHEGPEYGTWTWFTMLFAAGIGTILMFWGVAEPISHYARPPIEGVDPHSQASAKLAMEIALYHFGLHTWTIFTLPALAIGYFTYRQGLPMRISSIFYTVLGNRIYGPIGRTIDIVAVLGTLFGVAVSVSLGTLQLNSGLAHLAGDGPLAGLFEIAGGDFSRTLIVAIITVVATISVVLGLDRGIKRLSQFNIFIAMALLLFIWVTGPTLFMTKGTVENIGNYLQALPGLAFWTESYQDSDWQRSWTVFYWAWTISWAPYVGIFIARISKGRTIRQFIGGALGAPLLFTVVWFSVFGLAAIDLDLRQGIDISTQVQADVSVALFSFLAEFPWTVVTSILSVVIIIVFLTTSADSAALVIDLLSRRNNKPSRTRQRAFWTVLLGLIAGTLLLGGGLDALQNVITTLGFPFCVLLVFMAISLARALHADYLGYSLQDLVEGRAPPIDPMGADTEEVMQDEPEVPRGRHE